jgi:hypothetical protein
MVKKKREKGAPPPVDVRSLGSSRPADDPGGQKSHDRERHGGPRNPSTQRRSELLPPLRTAPSVAQLRRRAQVPFDEYFAEWRLSGTTRTREELALIDAIEAASLVVGGRGGPGFPQAERPLRPRPSTRARALEESSSSKTKSPSRLTKQNPNPKPKQQSQQEQQPSTANTPAALGPYTRGRSAIYGVFVAPSPRTAADAHRDEITRLQRLYGMGDSNSCGLARSPRSGAVSPRSGSPRSSSPSSHVSRAMRFLPADPAAPEGIGAAGATLVASASPGVKLWRFEPGRRSLSRAGVRTVIDPQQSVGDSPPRTPQSARSARGAGAASASNSPLIHRHHHHQSDDRDPEDIATLVAAATVRSPRVASGARGQLHLIRLTTPPDASTENSAPQSPRARVSQSPRTPRTPRTAPPSSKTPLHVDTSTNARIGLAQQAVESPNEHEVESLLAWSTQLSYRDFLKEGPVL